jgi:hypothetical protein
MATDTELTDSDEGKKVIGADGNEVGRVVEVSHGTAHVDPDPDISDTIMTKLGWGSRSEDTYPLQEEKIDSVTDDEIRLGAV